MTVIVVIITLVITIGMIVSIALITMSNRYEKHVVLTKQPAATKVVCEQWRDGAFWGIPSIDAVVDYGSPTRSP